MFHYNNVVAAYNLFVCIVSRAGRLASPHDATIKIISWGFIIKISYVKSRKIGRACWN
jgi:hypothetical protein